MSPVEVSVPLTERSALMMEGAAAPRPAGRRGAAGAAAFNTGMAGAASFGLLENMAARLNEIGGIAHDVFKPDFVMNMRSGGTPGGPDPPQDRALGQSCALFHADGGKMAIAGAQAEAVIDFHHIAIGAAIAGEYDGAGRGDGDF